MSRVMRIAGVDEAGRGPLAGPVVAAAIILPADHGISGIDDSKKLTATRRSLLAELLMQRCPEHAIVCVDAEQIDRINILNATLQAMREALLRLQPVPDLARIDGNRLPSDLPCPGEAIIGGDSSDLAIAAASILAKVTRDALMLELDRQYPQYGFARHKGYPSQAHLQALREHGPCPAHRRSYAPVRRLLDLASGR